MRNADTLSASERIVANMGFDIGDYHIGRLDKWSDEELETLRAGLVGLLDQTQLVLEGISLVEQSRYDQDTDDRQGRYAIE